MNNSEPAALEKPTVPGSGLRRNDGLLVQDSMARIQERNSLMSSILFGNTMVPIIE